MGVTNLLQYLRCNEKSVNIKRYKGSVAAIDTMCWIHRGLISSAVANVRGEICDKFLKFIISMITLLLSYNIRPIMVFDGYEMPAKKLENAMRRERREKAKKEALDMIKKNKNKINSEIMRKCMQAIHVTPEIVYRVISICKKINVTVIVSPFEADAQISYLCRSGFADFAISEDSDLIAYGCPKVLYKLDKDGRAMEMSTPFLKINKELMPKNPKNDYYFNTNEKMTGSLETVVESNGTFKDLNHRMFVVMCVLSGTDYDNGYHISGMGLKVAYKLILEHKTLDNILKTLYGDKKWAEKMPDLKYEELLLHYKNVCNIFLHNIVFNPESNHLIHINPLDNFFGGTKGSPGSSGEEFNYLYEMSMFLATKNVNFINVARGLVSVVDDIEISYLLSESELTMTSEINNKVKHTIYNTGGKTKLKLVNSFIKGEVKTEFSAVSNDYKVDCKVEESDFKSSDNPEAKRFDGVKEENEVETPRERNFKGGTGKSEAKGVKVERGGSVEVDGESKGKVRNKVGETKVDTKSGVRGKTKTETRPMTPRSTKIGREQASKDKKRKLKNLFENTECYTVKRTRVAEQT